MSDADAPFDAPADGPAEPGRPGSVTWIAAISLALGVLGLVGTVASCGGLAFNFVGADLMATGNPDQVAAQQALYERGRTLTALSAGLTLAVVPLAVLLAAGGGMVLGGVQRGARWLHRAFAYGLVLEPLRLLLQVVSVVWLWDETVALTAAAAGPLGNEGISMIVALSSGLGVLIGGLWMLAKVTFYLVGARVLNSEAGLDWQARVS